MKVDGTSVSFDLSELGLTAEQASNERVILKALLDYFNRNFQQTRTFGVAKFSDSKPVGMQDGSRANTYTTYIVLDKDEMAIFEASKPPKKMGRIMIEPQTQPVPPTVE